MLVVPLSSLSLARPRNPSRLRLLLSASAARVARVAMSTSSPPPVSTVSVEYAKSGRSICKGCSVAIASGALRLGTSTPDPRGFNATKWYHVSCFPSASRPLGPIEGIAGFDSIKDHDLEELRELEKNRERDHTPVGPLEEPSPKKAKTQISSPGEGGPDKDHDCDELRELEKNHKRDHTAVDPLEEPSPKKEKTQISSCGEGVPDKETISVEYAKSARSTCKGCSKNIAKGALRLGVSFRDPRGFESTKWYHVACFPTSSYTISPMENLKGFDLIEDKDRDKLQELKENHKRDISAAGQLDEPNLEKEMELPAGHKTIGTLIPFSVSDIKRTYRNATLPAHWKAFNTVIFREQVDGLHASAKIAAFDFDGCLANTNVRSIGADKWSLQHKSIPEKFQRLYDDGYKLVIFTNESNIERWKNKRQQAVDSKVGRLDNFIECVKVPIQVFIACGLGKGKDIPDDQYRKPNPGMWWLMAQHFNSGIKIDMDQSFYVGDAAGREKDHSDADIKFAKAIGLKFHVPEEYFG